MGIGLWDTLAPGKTVLGTSPTTTVIQEPGVPELRLRNNDIAKFGTKAGPTTEEKIAFHSNELRKKYRGDIKIRH